MGDDRGLPPLLRAGWGAPAGPIPCHRSLPQPAQVYVIWIKQHRSRTQSNVAIVLTDKLARIRAESTGYTTTADYRSRGSAPTRPRRAKSRYPSRPPRVGETVARWDTTGSRHASAANANPG